MPTTTKISVSLPSSLLARADEVLTRPGEGRSALLARLLDAAVRAAEEAEIDAEYERASREQPISAEEERLLSAFSKAGLANLTAGTPRTDG